MGVEEIQLGMYACMYANMYVSKQDDLHLCASRKFNWVCMYVHVYVRMYIFVCITFYEE